MKKNRAQTVDRAVPRASRASAPTRLLSHSLPLLTATLLAGCAGMGGLTGGSSGDGAATPPAAGLPELPPTGQGPAAPTAVVETHYTVDGAILPVVRGETRSSTRADMRRNDSLMNFDNWLLRRVAGDGRGTDITRIDRRLVWTLEPAKRQYTECPLTGCASPSRPGAAEERKPQPDKSEPSCPVTVKANRLEVTPSGERKTVNGFATERYQIGWTVDLEDQQGRRNSNKVALDLWTTPETGAVREVQQLNDAYQRRYASAISSGDNPIGQYLPRDVMNAMNRFLRNLDPKDTRTLNAMANEMRKIRGYPIVTTMSWTTQGAVCSDGSPASAASGGLGGLMSAISGNKPAAGAAATPLITYTSEVKTLAVRPVGDSAFVPPQDFQRKQ